MNDRSIIQTPEPGPGGSWLAPYLPDGHGHDPQPRPVFFNFAMLRGMLYRQRWLIAGVIVAALVGGLVFTLLATPMYSSTAQVRVSPRGALIVQGQDIEGSVGSNQMFDYLTTQAATIRSRSMADAVAADLRLGTRFDLLGKDIDERRPPNISDEKWLAEKTARAASMIQGMVSTEVPRTGWVLPITVSSESPTLAAELANGYADAFVASGARTSIDNNVYARNYLREQIAAVRAQLQEAEFAANTYARENGIITGVSGGPDRSVQTTLTTENLTEINARVAAARVARIEAEQRWRSIQNAPASQLPEAQSNPALQSLLAESARKRGELAELRQRYNDDFPRIQSLLSQVELLDEQIARTGADVKATVRNAYVVALNQENALSAELAAITGDKLVEQDKQVEYGVLVREAAALNDQLRALLARYNELSSAANIESSTIAKLDPALVPSSPVSPRMGLNMGLALVFGLALAGGLAVLREILDDRIRSLEDIEEKIGLALLGHTPQIEKGDLAEQENNRFSALMEAYSSIRAAVDFTLPRGRNVIQVTSSQASEGKSTTSVILAELFGSLGRKVLLVDADLRRPSIAGMLDMQRPKIGLVEVLLGHVEFKDAIVKGVHDNLDILPVGEIPPNPAEILASEEMRDFVEKYRHEYSLIIFDSCPVMGLADAPLIARVVDSTIFVLEANKVPFGQVRAAVRRIRAAGGNISGVVITKFRALEAGQSYDYQYAYYQYGK